MEKAKLGMMGLIVFILASHLMYDASKVLTWEAPQWEYEVEAIGDTDWDGKADTLGESGWEIVTCRRAQDASEQMMYECILKRERIE